MERINLFIFSPLRMKGRTRRRRGRGLKIEFFNFPWAYLIGNLKKCKIEIQKKLRLSQIGLRIGDEQKRYYVISWRFFHKQIFSHLFFGKKIIHFFMIEKFILHGFKKFHFSINLTNLPSLSDHLHLKVSTFLPMILLFPLQVQKVNELSQNQKHFTFVTVILQHVISGAIITNILKWWSFEY